VVDLSDPERQKKLLAIVPVSEVWGVGRKHTESLKKIGVTTALNLLQMDTRQIKWHYSIVMDRTVRALNGESYIDLDD